jgi:hypothetical protein
VRYLQDPVLDSYWKNRAGMGTTADRSRATAFIPEFASEATLADWYAQDGLFATAIGMMIEDALRQVPTINSGDAKAADGDEGSNDVQDQVAAWWADDCITELLTQYFVQKRLLGGSVLLQIADVDQSVQRPSNAAPDPNARFMAFAPSEMTGQTSVILDPVDPMYGYPLRWLLNAKSYDVTWTRPTRTAKLFSTNTHRSNYGHGSSWVGPSEAYRFMTQVQYWGLTVQAAVSALQMLSQRILKTPRLRQVQEGSATAVANFIETRLQDINDRASNQQAVVIDDSEDLLIAHSSISGMEAVMDRLMVAVAACARVPVVRLFGVSPGGFGTGESELRNYYDSVRVFQEREIGPAIKWMLQRRFAGSENWQIEFAPLGAPTEAELVAMRQIQAQTDATYVGTGVLSADEVAQSRFGGAAYSHETTLDMAARAEASEALELDPETEPDDPTPSTERPESDDPAPGTTPEADNETP